MPFRIQQDRPVGLPHKRGKIQRNGKRLRQGFQFHGQCLGQLPDGHGKLLTLIAVAGNQHIRGPVQVHVRFALRGLPGGVRLRRAQGPACHHRALHRLSRRFIHNRNGLGVFPTARHDASVAQAGGVPQGGISTVRTMRAGRRPKDDTPFVPVIRPAVVTPLVFRPIALPRKQGRTARCTRPHGGLYIIRFGQIALRGLGNRRPRPDRAQSRQKHRQAQ